MYDVSYNDVSGGNIYVDVNFDNTIQSLEYLQLQVEKTCSFVQDISIQLSVCSFFLMLLVVSNRLTRSVKNISRRDK